MANLKISQLTATTTPLATDLHVIVDTTDTSMAPSGTDKQITWANLLAGIATTFFALTPTGVVFANGSGNPATDGTTFIYDSTGNILTVPTLLLKTALRLEETGAGTDAITLQAPNSIAAAYTLTLPVDDGTNGQVLSTDGTGVLSWSTNSSGDFAGPASSTDNAAVRFDGTTGKLAQNSVVIISDVGAVSGLTNLTVDNINIDGNAITALDTNGSLFLAANGSGQIFNLSPMITETSLIFKETGGGSDFVTVSAPNAISASYAFTLPPSVGTAGQILTTDGAGNSSWTSSSGTITSIAPSTDNAIVRWDGITATVIQNSGVTISDTGIYNTASAQQLNFVNTSVLKTDIARSDVGVGPLALAALTTGANNVAVGSSAGNLITTGSNNICIGASSGSAAVNGDQNILIGTQAGAVLNDSQTVIIGYQAGFKTTVSPNVFIGTSAGYENVANTGNLYVGHLAGSLVNGGQNTYLGNQAGQGGSGTKNGTRNTFVGYQCGNGISTGTDNVGVGHHAGFINSTGLNNTYVGVSSGLVNLVGNNNTYLGYLAGGQATGSLNTFIGSDAGGPTTSQDNIGIGCNNLTNLSSGAGHIAIGNSSAILATTGNNNISIGTSSNALLTTGAGNIAIGASAGVGTGTHANCVILGTQAVSSATSQFVLGSSAAPLGTQTTVGAAGPASALPATPVLYLQVNLNGTILKIPCYTN